ncbi:MAG: 23S rRNA (guanosine(2251)-2'-O)-methyltransferase RlmB [Bacteroidales bacterium]
MYPQNKKEKKEIDFIYGIRSLEEALDSGKPISKVLIKKGQNSDYIGSLIRKCREMDIPVQLVPIEKLNSVTMKNHQGIVAFMSPVHYQKIEDIIPAVYEQGNTPLILILDKVTDVRNFGAICRTAECAGVHAVVFPSKGAAILNADAVKTSAGALLKIPVCRTDYLAGTIKFLKNSGLKIVGASEKSNTLLYSADFTTPVAIVMGAEDEGIEPEILNLCDETVSIPLHGTIASLNVSVAAGILLFEAVRQKTVVD